ncbi:MAG: Asp-tRNA(Asn)/Glu-tRNA(Gln) amidotransferase subunit GatA [Bacillota bacterium]|nr:Asp-tRNA(Asn)/Glu-tRNA(Gln) amidotransferase subunit GatA [Bacillota bacterium]
MDFFNLTAHEVRDLLRDKKVTSVELVENMFLRIESVESDLNAFLLTYKEEALEKAIKIDERINNGEELGDLAGIPIAIKDNMCTIGKNTTCASKILENFKPPYNATVIDKLEEAGAIIIGKTNMDEFAMGSSTENSAFKTSKNPWDLERVPGGSSGGSAAAVTSGEAFIALGSDTGGSIRQPASLCGIVGLKPTYGLVSRYGLIAFASSLDQIGPLSKDVEDTAIMLNAIAGHDKRDSTSANKEKVDYKKALVNDIKGMKIGVPKEYFSDGINENVKKVIYSALDRLVELGAEYEEISLSYSEYALPAYYIIAPAEASSNLARFDGIRYGYRTEKFDSIDDLYTKTRTEGFGEEVKRRIMIGTYSLASGYYDAYYNKAMKVRTLIKNDFDKAFEKYDCIITPTVPNKAFKIGEKINDPLTMYMEDVCTVPVNIAGVPAISIPAGFVDSMPIGMQIIGKHFDEETILRVAYTFEKNTDFNRRVKL